MSKSDRLFYTDWPMVEQHEGNYLKGPCQMNAINNAIQAELFSSCNTTRQIQSKAFQKRFSDLFPGKGSLDRYLKMQYELAGVEGGISTKVPVLILEAMGYHVERVPWLFDDIKNKWAYGSTKPIAPDINDIIDHAEETNANAVIIAHFAFTPSDKEAQDRHFTNKNVNRLHAICLRKIGESWWIFDGNYKPTYKHELKPKFSRHYTRVYWADYMKKARGANAVHSLVYIGHRHGKGKRRLDTGPERVVRRFVKARKDVKYVKQLGHNRGIKACGGQNVPVRSYTYKPTPAQSNCKSIQLKYGPGCKTYRKCISEATQWKMRGDEALSHF